MISLIYFSSIKHVRFAHPVDYATPLIFLYIIQFSGSFLMCFSVQIFLMSSKIHFFPLSFPSFFLRSTAGHEASGTGCMKFLMNGCLLLATADGSTIEIIEEIGADNMVRTIRNEVRNMLFQGESCALVIYN